MGIYVRDLTAAERQDVGRNRGAVAWAVVKDSPAYRADIVRGDIIQSLDERPVEDSRDLLSKIFDAAGKTVTVEIQRLGSVATLREGSRKTITVKLNGLPVSKKPPTSGH